MKRVFACLFVASCLGCQAGGQHQADSAYSSPPPASTGTTAVAAGNASNSQAGTSTSAGNAAADTNPNVSGLATAAGTLGKIWNAVGFQRPETPEVPPLSPEVARFNNFVATVSTQTSQLNINDPPEVTREKAQAIMTTLRDWDSILAAGRKIGILNDATSQLLTNSVQSLSEATQKLIQYAPQAETINAVKQIGGGLVAAYSSVQGLLGPGAAALQPFLGTPQQ